jgi:hypothetical protein
MLRVSPLLQACNRIACFYHIFCVYVYVFLCFYILLTRGLFHIRYNFREKFIGHKILFRFSLQILSDTFLFLLRIQRGVIINVHKSSCKVPFRYSCQILMKLGFSGKIFGNYYNKISWKSVQWAPICFVWKDGRTDRYDEANSLFSQFC